MHRRNREWRPDINHDVQFMNSIHRCVSSRLNWSTRDVWYSRATSRATWPSSVTWWSGIMVCSHCTGPGQRTGLGSMGSNIRCWNVHTGPRQGQEPWSIVSYCASPIPSTVLCPSPVQCEWAMAELLQCKATCLLWPYFPTIDQCVCLFVCGSHTSPLFNGTCLLRSFSNVKWLYKAGFNVSGLLTFMK